jgi:TatD DNase family protein
VLVDTHCHLNFESFDLDRTAVVANAMRVGVERILNPGIDLETSRAAVDLAEAFPVVYAAVGVHPNDTGAWNETTLGELRRLAAQPKVVAIGEIGLDYYWERTEHSIQYQVFQGQLDLAAELGLPVVIHIRDHDPEDHRAMNDALDILRDWQLSLAARSPELASRPGVLHSFSGDLQDAQRAIASGFCLGVTGPVTFKKADVLRQMATELPVEYLLIETDAPFLTPHPHRGERNEPAYVRFVAEKIAALRDLELDGFARITTQSAERVFRWQVM